MDMNNEEVLNENRPGGSDHNGCRIYMFWLMES